MNAVELEVSLLGSVRQEYPEQSQMKRGRLQRTQGRKSHIVWSYTETIKDVLISVTVH